MDEFQGTDVFFVLVSCFLELPLVLRKHCLSIYLVFLFKGGVEAIIIYKRGISSNNKPDSQVSGGVNGLT